MPLTRITLNMGGRVLKSALITSLKPWFRRITLRGRNARRARSALRLARILPWLALDKSRKKFTTLATTTMKSKTYQGLHRYAFYLRVLWTKPRAMMRIRASSKNWKVSASSSRLITRVKVASGLSKGWSSAMISELASMRMRMIFSKILLHLFTFLVIPSLSSCFLMRLKFGDCYSDESWLFLELASRILDRLSGVSSFDSSSSHINEALRLGLS